LGSQRSRRNHILSEEKLGEIYVRLKTSARKFLPQLEKQTSVSA